MGTHRHHIDWGDANSHSSSLFSMKRFSFTFSKENRACTGSHVMRASRRALLMPPPNGTGDVSRKSQTNNYSGFHDTNFNLYYYYIVNCNCKKVKSILNYDLSILSAAVSEAWPPCHFWRFIDLGPWFPLLPLSNANVCFLWCRRLWISGSGFRVCDGLSLLTWGPLIVFYCSSLSFICLLLTFLFMFHVWYVESHNCLPM